MKSKMRKLYKILDAFGREMTDCHVAAYASSAAFFMILSLIPILLLMCSIVPFTPITKADLLTSIELFVPEFLMPYAKTTINEVYRNSFTVMSISVIVTWWSAGKSMLAICRGLDTIHHTPRRENYVFLRLRASIYTIILLAILLISLLLGVFEEGTVRFLSRFLPSNHPNLTPLVSSVKNILIFLATLLMFLAIYTFLPNKKLKAKDQLIGATFSAFTWSIVSIIFSFYVSRFAAYSIYGSMTTIALTLLWFYCLFTVLFMGALIGRFLEPATQYLRNESLLNRRKSERKEQRKGKLQ